MSTLALILVFVVLVGFCCQKFLITSSPISHQQQHKSLAASASTTQSSRGSNQHIQRYHTKPTNEKPEPPIQLPVHADWQTLHPHKQDIVAFYNMYIAKSHAYPNIIEEQLQLLKQTGLLDKLNVIYYITIGKKVKMMPQNLQDILLRTKDKITRLPKFVQVRNTISSMNETLTLSYLYDFCQHNSDSKVLYFHDKGSYHQTAENTFFRHFLDCYVLNPQCIDALNEGFDTCGWRLSPLPNPHYSGNFWWAKCSHVNRLVHPAEMVLNSTFASLSQSFPHDIASKGRYFPESWVGSYPIFKPADCMSHEVDTTFFCCYELFNISARECPNHAMNLVPTKQDMLSTDYDELKGRLQQILANNTLANNGTLKIGSKCKAADVFTNGKYYSKLFKQKRIEIESSMSSSIVKELRKRSRIWYGQEPVTWLNAIAQFDVNATSSS